MTKFLTKLIIYIILILGATMMLLPFAWMVSTSFKTRSEVERWPPKWSSRNFLTSWKVKVKVSSGALGGLDWRGLTLREALILQDVRQEGKVLSIVITDDPVYRGTLALYFPANFSYLSGSLDINEYNNFLADLSSATKVKEVKQMISDFTNPEDFFAAFFAMYTQGLSALLERRNYVGSIERTLTSSLNQLQTFERYASRIPEEQRTEYLEYLKTSEKAFNDLLSAVGIFKRGAVPVLQNDEIEKILNSILSCLDQITFNKLNSDLISHPVLQLYKSRVIQPVEESANVLETYRYVLNYFKMIQKDRSEVNSIVFTFPTTKEKQELFIKSISEQQNLKTDLEIIKNLANQSLDGLPERYEKTLDEKLLQDFSHLNVHNLRVYIQQVKVNLANLRNFLSRVPEWTFMSNFESVKEILNALIAENPSALAALERLEILSSQVSSEDFQKLLVESYKNIDRISELRRIYSRSLSVMKIISAPEFVKEVRFKQNQNIEIELNNIHPIYLEDETYELMVDFNWKQVWANIFHNYVTAWKSAPFGRYYLNTVFVSVVTTVLEVVLAAMAAYAFAYMNFPGKNLVFGAFLATMMVPGEVLLVPNFITISRLGWIDTYYALIIPWIVSVFAIFLIRQHFLTLPSELKDAAMIDGCSHWRFLWTIVVPLSKPVIITSALLKLVGSWNAFLWVLIVTNKDKYRTLTVGLQTFSTEVGTIYNQLMAAATLSIIPIVILFIFTQKYFVRGIARTGLK